MHGLYRAIIKSINSDCDLHVSTQKLRINFNPIFKMPSTYEFCHYFLSLCLFIMRSLVLKRCEEKWSVFVCKNQGQNSQLRYNRVIPEITEGFNADSMILDVNNRSYIFYEHYQNSHSKGVIACASLDLDGEIIDNNIIIQEEYHLSFPRVIRVEDKYYMFVESSADRSINVYENVEWPNIWRYTKSILTGRFIVDATSVLIDDEIFLFYSEKYSQSGSPINCSMIILDKSLNIISGSQQFISCGGSIGRLGGVLEFNNTTYICFQDYGFSSYGDGLVMYRLVVGEDGKVTLIHERDIKKANYLSDVKVHTLNNSCRFLVFDCTSNPT